MAHWTKTPDGKKRLSERWIAYYKTPAGKKTLANRGKSIRNAWAVKRLDQNGGAPGHAAPSTKSARAASGRAMLVALARPEAERKIVALQREIETLRLFLDRTK